MAIMYLSLLSWKNTEPSGRVLPPSSSNDVVGRENTTTTTRNDDRPLSEQLSSRIRARAELIMSRLPLQQRLGQLILPVGTDSQAIALLRAGSATGVVLTGGDPRRIPTLVDKSTLGPLIVHRGGAANTTALSLATVHLCISRHRSLFTFAGGCMRSAQVQHGVWRASRLRTEGAGLQHCSVPQPGLILCGRGPLHAAPQPRLQPCQGRQAGCGACARIHQGSHTFRRGPFPRSRRWQNANCQWDCHSMLLLASALQI